MPIQLCLEELQEKGEKKVSLHFFLADRECVKKKKREKKEHLMVLLVAKNTLTTGLQKLL